LICRCGATLARRRERAGRGRGDAVRKRFIEPFSIGRANDNTGGGTAVQTDTGGGIAVQRDTGGGLAIKTDTDGGLAVQTDTDGGLAVETDTGGGLAARGSAAKWGATN